MTSNLYVHFDLGDYEDNPELESFSINPDASDIRVKQEEGNFCELVVGNMKYRTNELELEMSGGGWLASAFFEIPVNQESIGELQKAIASGNAKLKLGEYEYFSTKEQNVDIFDEDYLNFYGN